MKFLMDNAVSPRLAEYFRKDGYDAKHVRDYGVQHAPDEVVFSLAAQEKRILVSADTDFGTLLALRRETAPSVILLRSGVDRHPLAQAALLMANLPHLEADLQKGAIAVFDKNRIRVRRLPMA